MASTQTKIFSVSSNAHAVFDWIIKNARSVLQQKEDLDSEYVPVSSFGFGNSSFKWSLLLQPGMAPGIVGLRLRLTKEDGGKDTVMQATYAIRVFMPESNAWGAAAIGVDRKFKLGGDKASTMGHAQAISDDETFGGLECCLSANGTLVVRTEIEFDVASYVPCSRPVAMCSRLADFFLSVEMSDFILVSSDEVFIPVHSHILAAHSSVFRGMFQHETEEKKTGRAVIKDVDGKTLGIFLKFLYSGDESDVKANAEKVLEVADKYDLPDLRDLAADYLVAGLNLGNAHHLAVFADQRHVSKMYEAVSKFIIENWSSLRETPDFLNFKKTHGFLFGVFEVAWKNQKPKSISGRESDP